MNTDGFIIEAFLYQQNLVEINKIINKIEVDDLVAICCGKYFNSSTLRNIKGVMETLAQLQRVITPCVFLLTKETYRLSSFYKKVHYDWDDYNTLNKQLLMLYNYNLIPANVSKSGYITEQSYFENLKVRAVFILGLYKYVPELFDHQKISYFLYFLRFYHIF